MTSALETWESDLEAFLNTDDNTGPWTLFWDMHSGGHTKIGKYSKIYVQAPEDEATAYFESRFDRDPHYTTCDCCGPDYSVSEEPTLAEITSFHRETSKYKMARHRLYKKRGAYDFQRPFTPEEEASLPEQYMSVDEYETRDDVLIVYRRDME